MCDRAVVEELRLPAQQIGKGRRGGRSWHSPETRPAHRAIHGRPDVSDRYARRWADQAALPVRVLDEAGVGEGVENHPDTVRIETF